MDRQLDALFIAPSAAKKLYQDLSKDISVKQVNEWAGLLANSCRVDGFGVAILDMEVERLSYEDTAKRIDEANPRLVVFVCTGQNPNASTASMTGAVGAAQELRNQYPDYKIAFIGPHINALPHEVLNRHEFVDIVFTNEGVYALRNLLMTDLEDISKVKGIGYRKDGVAHLNEPERLVPQELLEYDLPGMAWDLMPSLDNYKTGYWQTYYHGNDRSPFASLYTSLGCPFQCEFCMINSINRIDNDPLKTARDFNTFRYWRPEFIMKEFDYLAEQNVKFVKIADEMFQLRPRHFAEICKLLKERDYGFNIWAYTRVDTVKEQNLQLLYDAGIVWHAIGIEAGNQEIRQEITKGKFQNINIRDIIGMIHNAGMDVGANYIFGLGTDSFETMQQTLELSIELSTGNANFYCATPLPGSPLYMKMKNEGWDLPTEYSEYGFLSYDHRPSPTANASTEDILAFRDYAYHTYFEHPKTLTMIYNKYGKEACNTIKKMNKIKLKRKLLEEHPIYTPKQEWRSDYYVS